MKTATSKAFSKRGVSMPYSGTCFKVLLTVIACVWTFTSYGAMENDSLPARNRHFFLVRLEQGVKQGQEEKIRGAFLTHEFTECELLPSTASVRLICEKGCSIERVREVLKELGLTMSAYQEAYTNQTPVFFR